MSKLITVLATLTTLTVPVAGYSQMGMMGMSMIRHHYVMRNGIDPKYADRRDPLQPTPENIEAGKKLYGQNCASCHGATGLGNGEAGKNLNPPPANIAASSKMPIATDAYLYWTVAEGGTPLGTAMPPFKSALKENEIWKIILYLRRL